MVHRLCAVASALALVVLLSPSSHDGGVVGLASAARREVGDAQSFCLFCISVINLLAFALMCSGQSWWGSS
jgi:hypothetical protein